MPNLLKISSDIESYFRNGFSRTLHTDLKVGSNFYDHYLQSCTKNLMLPLGSAMHVAENGAVELESMVKVATSACSPYAPHLERQSL